jgi:hypothetical protein
MLHDSSAVLGRDVVGREDRCAFGCFPAKKSKGGV